jgi:APA family basic amino acid/polyamine antiporter
MGDDPQSVEEIHGGLQRHFGLLQATALNVTMIVGAGVFVTIPLMLHELPGPYALWGWLAAGVLILADGLIWSELAAALPGSGGSYLYLLECYGRDRWGRLMAFLFVWQFLISGPLEIASGLIAMAQFGQNLGPDIAGFDREWTDKLKVTLGHWQDNKELALVFGPSRLAVLVVGIFLMWLLYRRITVLGRLTVTFWIGVLAVIAWILVEGAVRFQPAVAFDYSGAAAALPDGFAQKLGLVMALSAYSYLGYYNVCYMGDEVRDPARTIPRSILWSAALVCVLFAGLHLAMLGTVPWTTAQDTTSLPATFMQQIHGEWAVVLVSLLLIWSCLGSAFAALLGYSRIPYGAARCGHFFSVFARVHPVHRIPHIGLLLVGGLTLFWSLFGLEDVIDALIVTRVLEQFIGQAIGVMLLWARQPGRPRPFRMWVYPLPCLVALGGWAYLYAMARRPFIILGLATLATGVAVFFIWSWWTRRWPFATAQP